TIYSNSRSEDDMWVLSNYQEIKEPVIADWIRLSSDVTAYNDHKLGTNNTKSWKKYGGFMKLNQIGKDFELEWKGWRVSNFSSEAAMIGMTNNDSEPSSYTH